MLLNIPSLKNIKTSMSGIRKIIFLKKSLQSQGLPYLLVTQHWR